MQVHKQTQYSFIYQVGHIHMTHGSVLKTYSETIILDTRGAKTVVMR